MAAFIKGDPALAHIPVVLLTGAFEPVDEGRARSVGCDGVLVKPFEPQIVISRVKDLLAGRQPSGMWGAGPVAQGPVRQAAAGLRARARGAAGSGRSARGVLRSPGRGVHAPGRRPAAAPTRAGAAAARAARREPIPLVAHPGAGRRVAAAPKPSANDPFADWDPDLMGDRRVPRRRSMRRWRFRRGRPRRAPQLAATPIAAPPAPRDAGAASCRAGAAAAPPPPRRLRRRAARVVPPSLVEAFSALLAAEQRIGLSPSAATDRRRRLGRAGRACIVTEELIETVTARVVARLTDQSRQTILDAAERLVREEIERIKQHRVIRSVNIFMLCRAVST